jgi:predicted nucleic acid-binding protein
MRTGLDTNILVALMVVTHPNHHSVKDRFSELQGNFVCSHTNVGECLRLLTHPRVFPKPLKLEKAIHVLRDCFDYYEIEVIPESETWWLELLDLSKKIIDLKGNKIFDARIALVMKFNGIKMFWTQDSDFKCFPFLHLISYTNP